jgi:Winged helix DNA-binding domain
VAQGVVGPRRGRPVEAVRGLLCLQAQDFWSGVASVRVRSGATAAEVEDELQAGAVVRAWPLRGTLHLVSAADLTWLRALLAPRELALAATREPRLGITARVVAKAERVATALVSSSGPASRSELTAAWRAAGVDTTGERGYHLIWHLAQGGVLCFGPVRNGQQLLVAADSWIPTSTPLPRDEALEHLAHRYFESHGPATAADLSRWARLTAVDTAAAVDRARPRLASITVGGIEHLLGPSTEDELASCRKEAQGVVVLPGFDELLFGYRDRSPTVPVERDAAVFPHRNGSPCCTVLVHGQVVATWRRAAVRPGEPAKITPIAEMSDRAIRTAARMAAALT